MYLGGLCLITDRKASRLSYEDMVLEALRAGVRWIQYRDKERSRREIFKEAETLRTITRNSGAILIINDHADIALAVDADGVHLGQDDLPMEKARELLGKDKIVGISTHTLEQALNAMHSGADYIGFGPVFGTTTKDAGKPRGVGMLREIKRKVDLPLVAIGGISLENIRSVFEGGADAVAVASAILSGNLADRAKGFLDFIRTHAASA